ncbi:ParB/RepB/Spo0J family partition protein [uncultured Abyssibacter sp.]|uniref:ParB/RepB/Spo0J family partition protein n=1 Tax=uncultured Abyssibacter sp. TaxID=2320202 RepID=UPI0032B20FA5
MSATQSKAPAGDLRSLPMDQIDPNPGNPRLIFPQEELDKLIESISHEGVLVPIVVFPNKDGRYTLVDGERRFRSARDLGLTDIPALITGERTERDLLVQMFNIHLIREPWRDLPTAKALGRLIEEIGNASTDAATDKQLRSLTGLSVERIKQLKFALTLPEKWQDYVAAGTIPLNWFWELDKNVIRPLSTERPSIVGDLGEQNIAEAFIKKRLDGISGTDTVSLRKVRPIIKFAKADADATGEEKSHLDDIIRSLVIDENFTIEEAYEDTVQITVETDKLGRRAETMVANFQRLLGKASNEDELEYIKGIGQDLISKLSDLFEHY